LPDVCKHFTIERKPGARDMFFVDARGFLDGAWKIEKDPPDKEADVTAAVPTRERLCAPLVPANVLDAFPGFLAWVLEGTVRVTNEGPTPVGRHWGLQTRYAAVMTEPLRRERGFTSVSVRHDPDRKTTVHNSKRSTRSVLAVALDGPRTGRRIRIRPGERVSIHADGKVVRSRRS